MRSAESKYQDTLKDVTDKMVQINSTDEEQLFELIAFVDAEASFHKTSLDLLSRLTSDLDQYRLSKTKPKSSFNGTTLMSCNAAINPYGGTLGTTAPTVSGQISRKSSNNSLSSSSDQLPSKQSFENGFTPNPAAFAPAEQPRLSAAYNQRSVTPPPPPGRRPAQPKAFIKQVRTLHDFGAENKDELSSTFHCGGRRANTLCKYF